jgi:hypothetical protein
MNKKFSIFTEPQDSKVFTQAYNAHFFLFARINQVIRVIPLQMVLNMICHILQHVYKVYTQKVETIYTILTSIKHRREIFCRSFSSCVAKSGIFIHWGFICSNRTMSPVLKAYRRSTSQAFSVDLRVSRIG